uniref:Cytochrome c oxidase subunit 3 n=1 Tax=Dipylidium caninum TaxID=66787 RepID=A0A2P1H6E9_DIPCN|nr:cytochrome c oxidase subunit 3 [Dipylidium caninum]UKT60694.1 cytochrome c oxidase subunit 3 [Dipylidium caninum]
MLSIIPFYVASFVGFVLVGFFMWNVDILLFEFVCLLVLLFFLCVDYAVTCFHYESAFWLFILSEVIIFGTLFVSCLYFDRWSYVNLSSALEIPFLGCFLLLGSSVTITAFHHLLGWYWSWVLLLFTVILGLCFVLLQVYEMNEISINIFDSSFHAVSFCVVGLHFSHVLLGVIGLVTILICGVSSVGVYRCTVMTWYWHFVDYIWLFVYMFVYVC